MASNFISKNDFRSKFGISDREIELASTGDKFKVRALNMVQKRQIRENNLTLNLVATKESGGDSSAQLDIEGLMVDTIIAACHDPNFGENDKDWMITGIDSTYLQELYDAIETPVKVATLTEPELGN
tara:strand:+ start:227 stop:607 length:381 start_codon:yes stop_codon:yes gene_type:complete